jgi:hypothetical protein
MARKTEPHKTSQTPDREARRVDDEAPEWRGGDRPQQEARTRSDERGWGAPRKATEEEEE